MRNLIGINVPENLWGPDYPVSFETVLNGSLEDYEKEFYELRAKGLMDILEFLAKESGKRTGMNPDDVINSGIGKMIQAMAAELRKGSPNKEILMNNRNNLRAIALQGRAVWNAFIAVAYGEFSIKSAGDDVYDLHESITRRYMYNSFKSFKDSTGE